jgi:hypothetical protein
MIDISLFPQDDQHRFLVGGYSEEELTENMSFIPDWVPGELRDFFTRYFTCEIHGVRLSTPGPAMFKDNVLREDRERFCGSYPGKAGFFPIAYLNGDSWVVYRKYPDGTVGCGRYDFSDNDWYGGAPFPTLEEFLLSLE